MVRVSKIWLLLLALVVIGTLAVGAIYRAAYQVRAEAREQFFQQYNRQQLLLAEQASRSVEDFFDTLRRNLEFAASLFENSVVTRDRAEVVKSSLGKLYQSLADTAVIDLVVFDREGTVVSIYPPDPYTLGRNYAWRDYYQWARDKGRSGQMYISPFMRLEGGQLRGHKALIVAEGIYSKDGRFQGVVAMPFNFDDLAKRNILNVRIGEHGYAWLVDMDERTVLVDPNGRVNGMSFKDAFLPRWKQLYDLLLSTAAGRAGTGAYEFEDPADHRQTVSKLVAYQPVRLQGRLWTLGVATPVREVEAQLSSFLQRQEVFSLTLTVAVVVGIIVLAGALLTWNRLLSRRVEVRTRDLDEARSKLETTFNELLVAKKLGAVGQLALGIVHEIRNPLSAIRMNIQMIRKKLSTQPKLQEHFSMVDAEVLRLNNLLNDLMGFARPGPLRLQETDLVEVVRRIARLMDQRFKSEAVTLELAVPKRLPAVCDAEQIGQVMLNLVINAMEAMAGNTTAKVLRIGVRRDGNVVVLNVEDTGPGIAVEDRDKLFDPFFTTKTAGGGLGLSTVQSIVAHHHGSVSASNGRSGGAQFTVRLPLRGLAENVESS